MNIYSAHVGNLIEGGEIVMGRGGWCRVAEGGDG